MDGTEKEAQSVTRPFPGSLKRTLLSCLWLLACNAHCFSRKSSASVILAKMDELHRFTKI